jgi:hypothetical protein
VRAVQDPVDLGVADLARLVRLAGLVDLIWLVDLAGLVRLARLGGPPARLALAGCGPRLLSHNALAIEPSGMGSQPGRCRAS